MCVPLPFVAKTLPLSPFGGPQVKGGEPPPAMNAGIRIGSIVLQVNGSPIKSIDDIRAAVRGRGGSVADFCFFLPERSVRHCLRLVIPQSSSLS